LRVIGISGLANSVAFKRRHWPELNEREYRISQGHDSAAALVVDGTLVAAAAEERFNHKKHTGDFPVGAIHYCLSQAGITLDQVDEIDHGFDYSPLAELYMMDPLSAELYRNVLSKEALLRSVRDSLPSFPLDRVVQVNHHLAHAASAYFTSGWDDCLVVVIDAMGETQSVTIYHAHHGTLSKIREMSANDSIGILYSLVTLHLGFDFNADEYKIMGLAPYGDAGRFRAFFEKAVELMPDGSIRIPILRLNHARDERENYTRTRQYLSENLIAERQPEDEIADIHRDVAAALQACLSRVVLHICGHFGARTGLRNLALAGGVALNCTANGCLMSSGIFDEIYIQPAAGDDGAALGAALYGASEAGETANSRMPVPFFGPSYPDDQIENAVREFTKQLHVTRFSTLEETCAQAAQFIAQGKVVAWHRGRMEFGPRALGNRSILADPGDTTMRDRINAMVKKREGFRPFAPAVSIEQVHVWFDVPEHRELPYMIATVEVRKEHRAALPAITHVDGSARVQTVSALDNRDFHMLLRAVGEVTGREMVLNTSFNVKGQPMVNTPREALTTFLGTGIDFLFLENRLIARRAGIDSN
jgi:carbamoyltransferase